MTRASAIALLTCAGLAALHAESRSSADYAIPAETFDAAGESAACAAYASSSSMGGIVGSATAASAGETANQGYIAQLPATTGLSLTAPSVAVHEGATLQGSAWETLEDGTRAPAAGGAVTWSIASGPASVNSTGLLTANIVFQDSAASVSGSYGGFTATLAFTVVNSGDDNFGSYAGDGLSDAWQVLYFGVGNANAAPALDPDHDGMSNAAEYAAALVPTDATSRLLMEIQTVPGQPTQRRIVFSPRYEGRNYVVQTSPDFTHWSPLASFTTSDSGLQRTVTDLAATPTHMFYRVVITTSYDYAADDLPDAWQELYFGFGNANAAPDQDPDHDGSSNAFEYAAGLLPTDATSRFSLQQQAVPGQPTQRQISFSPRYEGHTYSVETSTDLSHWSPLTSFTITDAGARRTVTDLAASGPRRYYRVAITRP
ncbi:MAG: hypothetical protein WCK77_02760 [Verrucomicrobiota bacterium]